MKPTSREEVAAMLGARKVDPLAHAKTSHTAIVAIVEHYASLLGEAARAFEEQGVALANERERTKRLEAELAELAELRGAKA